MAASPDPEQRRPLKTRDKAWARRLAASLARGGLSPDAVSLLSIVFAAVAMACFLIAPDVKGTRGIIAVYLGAVAGIQLRLLCNLLDGMIAVEHERKSSLGGLFNEVPDRIADVLILVGAGYSTSVEPGVVKLLDALPLGWSCAVVALWTAYIRSLGAELTRRHIFTGPMAKPHRMAALTIGALLVMAARLACPDPAAAHQIMVVVFTIILAGSLLTCWRRLRLILRALREAAGGPS